MSRGSFCISIDVELAWGIRDRPSADYFARCAEQELTIVNRLVALFDRYEVPATWAIVGRLLELDKHPPAASVHGDQIWFAPEVIAAIQKAKTPQDVGSHSFAHIDFARASRDEAREDLDAARRVHERHGLPFTSFVFPRNQVGHVDLLAAAGVHVFRSVDVGWHTEVRNRFGRLPGRAANLVDKLTPIAPRPVHPIQHTGIVELPSSMLLMSRSGVRQVVPSSLLLRKATRGLASARDEGGTFHLWFHPSNFYYEQDRQLRVVEDVLRAAVDMRARSTLDIRPMNTFAASRN